MKKTAAGLFAVTCALLLGTLAVARTVAQRPAEKLARPLSTVSDEIAGWSFVSEHFLDERVLGRLIPTAYLQRTYRKNGTDLDLFIAYYAQQRAGESMHSPKHCLPGAGWEIWRHGSLDVPFDNRTERINDYGIENGGQRMTMLYWYQSGSRIVASEYVGKVLLARDTLMRGRTAAAIVRIAVPDRPGMDKEGAAFASALMPQIQHCFR
jgi:EpsI family protein